MFFKDVGEILSKYYMYILRGVGNTLLLALTGTILGLLIGILIGIFRNFLNIW